MWKKKHTQTIKQDCWSLCVGVKEIETYQKLYAFGTCIREGAFSFPTSLQWHSIWRIIPLSNTLVTMVIHHLCMITHRMRTRDHLINHLRYMGWATKYRLRFWYNNRPDHPLRMSSSTPTNAGANDAGASSPNAWGGWGATYLGCHFEVHSVFKTTWKFGAPSNFKKNPNWSIFS